MNFNINILNNPFKGYEQELDALKTESVLLDEYVLQIKIIRIPMFVVEHLELLMPNAKHFYNPAKSKEHYVDTTIICNARDIIHSARKGLCFNYHKRSNNTFRALKSEIFEFDPNLSNYMVVDCVYKNGLCSQLECCLWNKSKEFDEESEDYNNNFE